MKLLCGVIVMVLFCVVNTGVCADKVVVIPLISDEKPTGNASSGDVLSGKTFSNATGSGLTGTMNNVGAQNITPGTSAVVITQGYHNGSGTVAGDTNLTAENIRYGVTIFDVTGTNRSHKCGAYITPDVWKIFDCYNLAAIGQTTDDDPFTPSWRLIGGYWQWGRKGPDSSQWYNTNTANFAHGPTGPDAGSANEDTIIEWDTTQAQPGSWSDASKTANDPCPLGFRVPTDTQWNGVRSNNTQSVTGTWSDSATNYSSARFFGVNLMLPAAGARHEIGGVLLTRGFEAWYWASQGDALFFDSSGASMDPMGDRFGVSVRCVAE